ncbi:hypothetical protein GW952_31015 (plasmid) [Klebsiella michiganensis]|uniref:Uncharacterized protein n=2 Tax=Klebsiella michiganensis TaxID=1134687 RepID=A0A6P1V4R2_9ENTR|nr:hypothetical protein [Klebsiella michiganensis]QHS50131.1 hypothetical protein GW952_31015 [Klebsiella michiganensis]HDX8940708.1 hypothetical protein [Klebsiella michiganensis]
MTLSPYARDVLRHYRMLINTQRKAAGLSPLTTAQVLDDMCEYLKYQHAVYIGGQYIRQNKQ